MAQDRRPPQTKLPNVSAFIDEAEADELAYMAFPKEHWSKIRALNGKVKRRTDVVGIFPNDEAIVKLVDAAARWNKRTNGPSSAPVT
jgi:transposase-like protein